MALAVIACGDRDPQQTETKPLPDWRGLWIPDDGVMTRIGLRNDVEGDAGPNFKDLILARHPPYNAEWEVKYQGSLQAQQYDTSGKECGFHFPGVMEIPWEFEVLITPAETVMIFAGREIRHIYTDGRAHPPADELWPMEWADSIGKWEGDTLVIDTISAKLHTMVGPHGPMLSADARFTERIRRVDEDHLENRMTITDPATLTQPWELTIPYVRLKGANRLIHGDCAENDRNPVVNGQVTVAPRTR